MGVGHRYPYIMQAADILFEFVRFGQHAWNHRAEAFQPSQGVGARILGFFERRAFTRGACIRKRPEPGLLGLMQANAPSAEKEWDLVC